MNDEERMKILNKIHNFIGDTGGKILPEDKFQEAIKSGGPVICTRYDPKLKKEGMELWLNEALKPSLTGDCALCGNRIMFSPQVKAATFKICIQCLMEHKDELMKDQEEEGDSE